MACSWLASVACAAPRARTLAAAHTPTAHPKVGSGAYVHSPHAHARTRARTRTGCIASSFRSHLDRGYIWTEVTSDIYIISPPHLAAPRPELAARARARPRAYHRAPSPPAPAGCDSRRSGPAALGQCRCATPATRRRNRLQPVFETNRLQPGCGRGCGRA